jgi:acetyltransferase
MLTIEPLTPDRAETLLPELTALLIDAVEGGASVGYLPPLAEADARKYWQSILGDVADGSRFLFVALQDRELTGSVQLELAMRPNGRHRAEIQKLLVFRQFRGQGIAGQLMAACEDAARAAGRSLLVLDTRRGDTADRLYRKLGWVEAGVIPQFAISAAGTLDDTVIFYKLLNA